MHIIFWFLQRKLLWKLFWEFSILLNQKIADQYFSTFLKENTGLWQKEASLQSDSFLLSAPPPEPPLRDTAI